MIEPTTMLLFALAALAMLLTPGPAVLYIVARSVEQGRIAGLVSMLGVHVATLVHVVAATLGLSAVLLSSLLAFSVLKYVGAGYLIYLGIRAILSKDPKTPSAAGWRRPLTANFSQGFVVNLLNPKTALFFFAFLPQFVDAELGGVTWQFLFFGCLFVALGTCTDGLYALLAGSLRTWFQRSTGFLRGQRYFSGSVYIGLGLATAVSGPDRK